jgi:YceI-like domain
MRIIKKIVLKGLKNSLVLILIMFGFGLNAHSQYYLTQAGETSFFSETPMENISALNQKVGVVINPSTNDVAVKITITQFKFKNNLMEEHFNENYLESGKFPHATFKGKITEKIDYTKDGEYAINVIGKLQMHGVTKEKIIIGKIIISKGTLIFIGNFDVKLVDFKIEVPSLVFTKVAESITIKNKYTLNLKSI